MRFIVQARINLGVPVDCVFFFSSRIFLFSSLSAVAVPLRPFSFCFCFLLFFPFRLHLLFKATHWTRSWLVVAEDAPLGASARVSGSPLCTPLRAPPLFPCSAILPSFLLLHLCLCPSIFSSAPNGGFYKD